MFDDMDGVAAARPGGAAGEKSGSTKEPSRVRVEFPETWLWSESSTGYRLIAEYYLWSEVSLIFAGALVAETVCDFWFLFRICCISFVVV